MSINHFTGFIHFNPIFNSYRRFQLNHTVSIMVWTATEECIIIKFCISSHHMLYTACTCIQITLVVSSAILIPVKRARNLQIIDSFRCFNIT